MNNRVTTGLLFTLAMLLLVIPAFAWPLWTLLGVALLAIFMSWELHQALVRIFKPLSLPLMMASSLSLLVPGIVWYFFRKNHPGWQFIVEKEMKSPEFAAWQTDFLFLTGGGMAVLLIFIFFIMLIATLLTVLKHGPARIPQTAAALSSGIYLGVPLSCITLYLFAVPNGFRWLLPALFLPWVSDVAAYYAGSFLGKTPFFNKISPNKTLEGALGGILGGALVGGIYFIVALSGTGITFHTTGVAFVFGFIAGALLALAGEMGDLFASALKRWTGIKDFSQALPGHGGFLDRFDSVLFSLPLSLVLCLLYYLI